jgi:hypothetical protein
VSQLQGDIENQDRPENTRLVSASSLFVMESKVTQLMEMGASRAQVCSRLLLSRLASQYRSHRHLQPLHVTKTLTKQQRGSLRANLRASSPMITATPLGKQPPRRPKLSVLSPFFMGHSPKHPSQPRKSVESDMDDESDGGDEDDGGRSHMAPSSLLTSPS